MAWLINYTIIIGLFLCGMFLILSESSNVAQRFHGTVFVVLANVFINYLRSIKE
jgi:uncharacterized membrane protein